MKRIPFQDYGLIGPLICGCFGGAANAAEDPASATFFENEIAPLLKRNCYECHSHEGGKAKGGLVLDSKTGWVTGGDSGPAIVPGNIASSRLAKAISYDDPDLQMPPDGKLPGDLIAKLHQWIASGAHDPRTGIGGGEDGKSTQIKARDLWSFHPLKKIGPPVVDDPEWSNDAIDRFIRAKLDAASLPPAPVASNRTLLRRLHLDLTGLPPTPQELNAFETAIAENRDRVLREAIDRLLESPAFGERWARHWLDLTAYADTIGVGRAIPALEAWRYRDYVIDVFNRDKPLTQFIREQISGDIQTPSAPRTPKGPPPTAEGIIATGFLAIGPWELVGGDKEQLWMDVIDRQITRIGKAFLGLTLDCARCHDHKFDPVPQHDYYALAGLLKSTVTLDGRIDGVFSAINLTPLPETSADLIARADRVKAYEDEVATKTRLRDAANAKVTALKKQLAPLQEQIEKSTTNEDSSPLAKKLAELESQRDTAAAEAKKNAERLKVLDYLRRSRTESLAFAVRDGSEPEDCRINIRGNAHQLGEIVPRGFLSEVEPKEKPFFTRGGSGRVQLAEWIASEKNPLTARVWVNRVWYHLFGTGLVRTVDNFGARGESPSHPELLDHLAAEFMRENWSTKQLVRRILLTRTWQQASTNPNAIAQGAEKTDPENRLLWRAHRTRLEAEIIRDAMLAVSGKLDLARGGPSLPVDVPGNLSTGSTGTMKDNLILPTDQQYRRTIYLPQKRKGPFDPVDFLAAFDLPDTNQETGSRTLTAVPAQALTLVNSPFVQECGQALADRFAELPPEERLSQIYLTLLSRRPDPVESKAALTFVEETCTGLAKERPAEISGASLDLEAWTRLNQSLLISNEFLFRE